MATFELDEHDVQVILTDLRGHDSAMARELADRLESQIPLAVPTGVGAVVRTEGGFRAGVYLRWAHDNATHSPWIEVGDHESPHRSDAIGRIVEVLSPGVDP